MALAFVGPIRVQQHCDPSFSWSSDLSTDATRGAQISGRLDWEEAWAIHELIANPARRISVGQHTGVLEVIWANDELQRPFNGWYLLQSCSVDAAQRDSLTDIVPCTISGLHLGSSRLVVSRFARALPDNFSLTSLSLAVQPLWGENAAGQPFDVTPGGSSFTRDYDPRTDYDPASPSTTNRKLLLQQGTVT